MDDRHLESVPNPRAQEPHEGVVAYAVRMDLADDPTLIRQELHWMNENDHVRYQQITAIANRLSKGDMAKKESILQGAAVDNLIRRRSEGYSMDDELAEVIPMIEPDEEPEKRRRFFRRRGIGSVAVAGVAGVLLTFRPRRSELPSGDDAA